MDVLADLRVRLARTRWPDAVWKAGAGISYMQELVEYWRTDYDWRKQEAFINSFANYRADINGVGIRFILTRGWQAGGTLAPAGGARPLAGDERPAPPAGAVQGLSRTAPLTRLFL